MPFKPINPRNAVAEAIVSLRLNRPLLANESEIVRQAHGEISEELPSLQSTPAVMIGAAPPGIPLPSMPIQMASYKRDGSIGSRLLWGGNILTINLLEYTRWAELWAKGERWLRVVLSSVSNAAPANLQPPLVMGLAHQMVDVFRWEGEPEDASVRGLIADNSPRLPPAARVAGRQWSASHAMDEILEVPNLGFRVVTDTLNCEMGAETGDVFKVRIVHTLEFQFAPHANPMRLFDTSPSQISSAVNVLHERNKNVIRELLAPEPLNLIGMGENE